VQANERFYSHGTRGKLNHIPKTVAEGFAGYLTNCIQRFNVVGFERLISRDFKPMLLVQQLARQSK
jgi:hypothetical protein